MILTVSLTRKLAGVTVGGYGYKSASVAGYAGIGFEVGLSAVIHRTGHMIEYGWDQVVGVDDVSMRRSDGTILELVWDRRTHRMASVWLKHEDRPDEEPVRLISYEYDAHGRLRRAINYCAWSSCHTTMTRHGSGVRDGRTAMGCPIPMCSMMKVG